MRDARFKERPILLCGEMVRAVLDGRKTQTRRVVKRPLVDTVCPYGKVGERLWVREAFMVQPNLWGHDHQEQPIHYLATTRKEEVEDYVSKPSIHMPRWASRLTLEIVRVRVERVQDISEQDAMAEGCAPVVHEDGAVDCGTRKTTFRKLWDSLNADRGFGWATNPWVWVIEFKRLTPC